jgi:hypothetical protein
MIRKSQLLMLIFGVYLGRGGNKESGEGNNAAAYDQN